MGIMHLKMQVGLLSCPDDFFVMPSKSMVLSMILGTPWQRKYKALPHWDTNAIHFQQEDGYISRPFVPTRSATSSTQLKVVTNKGKQKAASSDNHSTLKTKPQIMQAQATTSFMTNQPKPIHNIKETTQRKQWVDKRLVRAQEGQAHIWIPKNSSKDQNSLLRVLDLSHPTSQRTPNQNHSPSRHNQQTKQVHSQTVHQRWIPKRSYQA